MILSRKPKDIFPFEQGETRTSKGVSPIESIIDQPYHSGGENHSSSKTRLKETEDGQEASFDDVNIPSSSPSTFNFKSQPEHSGSNRFDLTPFKKHSPTSANSATPKATLINDNTTRERSTTPTPSFAVTAHTQIYTIPSSSPEDNWGDEALLSWDGEDDAEVVSVSSVASSEAGLDREEDDEEDWGEGRLSRMGL